MVYSSILFPDNCEQLFYHTRWIAMLNQSLVRSP